jgi:hypothetical protein
MKKIILSFLIIVLASFSSQAQIPGTPFFWQQKKVVPVSSDPQVDPFVLPILPLVTCGSPAVVWSDNFGVKISNSGMFPTSGPITIKITNPNYTISGNPYLKLTWDSAATSITSSTLGQTYAVDNGNWIATILSNGDIDLEYIGAPLAPNQDIYLGFGVYYDQSANTNCGTNCGISSMGLGVSIKEGSGGEVNFSNNTQEVLGSTNCNG